MNWYKLTFYRQETHTTHQEHISAHSAADAITIVEFRLARTIPLNGNPLDEIVLNVECIEPVCTCRIGSTTRMIVDSDRPGFHHYRGCPMCGPKEF
jgi:hypothetical protein